MKFKIGDVVKFKQGPCDDLFKVIAVRLEALEAINLSSMNKVVLNKNKVTLV